MPWQASKADFGKGAVAVRLKPISDAARKDIFAKIEVLGGINIRKGAQLTVDGNRAKVCGIECNGDVITLTLAKSGIQAVSKTETAAVAPQQPAASEKPEGAE